MFSFTTLFAKVKPAIPICSADSDDTNSLKMSLADRQAWRIQMMRKSVEDAFRELHIISGMYRYRVMAVDDRKHYFAIMVETTKHFAVSEYTSVTQLTFIEDLLKKRTFDNYGVVVDGVYWKVNETIDVFENATKKLPLGYPSDKPSKTIEDLTAMFSDTMPVIYESEDIPEFGHVSSEEEFAFRSSIASRQKPEPFHIGDREYSTDIMPLGPN